MATDVTKYVRENFKAFENGEYRLSGLKLWWTERGYQVDNTARIVTTKEEVIEELYLANRMKFGKYANKRIRNIEDAGYLQFLKTINLTPTIRKAVDIKLKRISYYAR